MTLLPHQSKILKDRWQPKHESTMAVKKKRSILNPKQIDMIEYIQKMGARIRVHVPEERPLGWFALIQTTYETNSSYVGGTRAYSNLANLLTHCITKHCWNSSAASRCAFYILPSYGGISDWLINQIDHAVTSV